MAVNPKFPGLLVVIHEKRAKNTELLAHFGEYHSISRLLMEAVMVYQ